jgi:hypothetical protein
MSSAEKRCRLCRTYSCILLRCTKYTGVVPNCTRPQGGAQERPRLYHPVLACLRSTIPHILVNLWQLANVSIEASSNRPFQKFAYKIGITSHVLNARDISHFFWFLHSLIGATAHYFSVSSCHVRFNPTGDEVSRSGMAGRCL